jgi:hypothetical protein
MFATLRDHDSPEADRREAKQWTLDQRITCAVELSLRFATAQSPSPPEAKHVPGQFASRIATSWRNEMDELA